MFTKFALPSMALSGLILAVLAVVWGMEPPKPSKPIEEPPTTHLRKAIAGAGLVEAKRENIPIGANIPGVVTEVFVKVHDLVQKGDPLFVIDTRDFEAELRVRNANLAAAQAQRERLKVAPQGGMDIPTARAAVAEATARLNDAEATLGRDQRLMERQMIPASDYDRDKFAYQAAKAALERAQADLRRIEMTWEKDIAVAEAAVLQAESQVESVQTQIARATVRALTDGEILQVNIRPGQFAGMVWREPLIVLGDVNRLHVRVDIDEQDVPWFKPGTPAFATLKGRPGVRFPLEFVKVEPYVIPKTNLTGDNSERVDTRVLQVIYALPDQRPIDVYVGQQMDIYLQAVEPPKGLNLDTGAPDPPPFEDARPALASPP
jgi:HlyD family secretion protein